MIGCRKENSPNTQTQKRRVDLSCSLKELSKSIIISAFSHTWVESLFGKLQSTSEKTKTEHEYFGGDLENSDKRVHNDYLRSLQSIDPTTNKEMTDVTTRLIIEVEHTYALTVLLGVRISEVH